jgi:hypothetical protein
MTNTIDDFKGSDIIDVRDIIARVEELRDSQKEHIEAMFKPGGEYMKPWADFTVAKELAILENLLKNLCGYGGDEQWEGDWYPVTLIKDSYFEESMDEMVADCYQLPKEMPYWMSIKIDYEELKQDYSEVEFEDDTYYYR